MYLERINSPADLRNLSVEEVKILCAEIRSYMLECCATNPGHVASSLGSVELIAGIHYVFNTPEDKVVFDVGHQTYAHKILTGRKDAFRTIRTEGGLSGFPRREESEWDAFGAGHSSTSISAALGFAEAARLTGSKQKAIAFIGDGALTGGLALEGLNNAGDSAADLLVILNDNNHSIDDNIGGLHQHLLNLTTSRTYNRLKERVWERIGENKLRTKVQNLVHNTKTSLLHSDNASLFEALGFRYFGPIDGNDIEQVTKALRRISTLGGPRILHCITTKGKGYAPAEQNPTIWHAPGRFNHLTGERIISEHKADRYQDVFGRTLVDLASKDPRVVGITPAMATGCGMDMLEKEMPDRFFDVGIEEEHAVTFSAGLCAGGMKPFCNIYSSFSQRAYDEIIHDVALQNLPVIFCFDRAGVVGEDGATHNGVFDLAAYRSIPGMTLAAPSDECELRDMMYSALDSTSPIIIRYPRGEGEGRQWKDKAFGYITQGKAVKRLSSTAAAEESVAVIALGNSVWRAIEAAEGLGGKVSIWDARFLKPIDMEMLEEASHYKYIVTLEDGAIKGGLFSEVAEYLVTRGSRSRIIPLGTPDEWIRHAKQASQRRRCGLDTASIKKTLEDCLEISEKVLQNQK